MINEKFEAQEASVKRFKLVQCSFFVAVHRVWDSLDTDKENSYLITTILERNGGSSKGESWFS